MNAKQKNDLEILLDKSSVGGLLLTLTEICQEKASHVADNWNDDGLCKKWEKAAMIFDKAYRDSFQKGVSRLP